MKLVAARHADRLCRAVAAESWGARNLAVGHDDGSISIYDKHYAMQLIWLNPGERNSSLTAIDVYLLAGFTSGALKLLSMDTGLIVAETTLPIEVKGVHVLEHYLVCWSKLSPKLWILQRSNLDLWQCIDTSSPVLNVFSASKGVSIVCSSDVYMLKFQDDRKYDLRRILQVSSPFIAGTLVNHRWLLVRPNKWSLFSLVEGSDTLDEEFKVDPPNRAIFHDVISTNLGAFLLSNTGVIVLVRDNNIQVLDSPKQKQGIWTAGAQIVWPDLTLSEAHSSRGEVEWCDHNLPVSLVTTKYLMGSSDPSITATYGDYIGTADGRINGVAVLPAPVLHIDAEYCQCRLGNVALPLKDVNLVGPPKKPECLVDRRVSVQTCPYSPGDAPLVGISTATWTTLRPLHGSIPAPMLALLVLEGHRSVDQILSDADISLTTVAHLEDLAVTGATLNNVELCRTVAYILEKTWTSKRVAELMQSAGPRSLQVLSAVYPYIDIPKAALQALIVSMLDGPRSDREAIFWVYEHKLDLVDDLVIPFGSLRGMSEDTITRFAQRIAVLNSDKLLHDASTVVSSALNPPATAVSVDNSQTSLAETSVMTVLLAALSSPVKFPPSDKSLANLVALVAPAMRQRVPGAKKILAKLVSQSQVQYHQGKQRLLVPTPTEGSQAALVFEFGDSNHEPVVLQRAPQNTPQAESGLLQMVFSADGKSVYSFATQGKLVWHFGGALRTLFKSKQPIEPVFEH